MELHTLTPSKGSVKTNKRRGRGQASGSGGTSSRGHKGAKSRSGYSRKRAFEGGQMPLQMRLPKRGFKSPSRVEYVALNLSSATELIDKYNLSEVSHETLFKVGVIKKRDVVKLLGNGEISKPVTFKVNAVSKSALEKVEKAGGTVSIL